MKQAQVQFASVQKVMSSFHDHRQLSSVVRMMAREIERLREDNRQLYAAVGMYREVVRRVESKTH